MPTDTPSLAERLFPNLPSGAPSAPTAAPPARGDDLAERLSRGSKPAPYEDVYVKDARERREAAEAAEAAEVARVGKAIAKAAAEEAGETAGSRDTKPTPRTEAEVAQAAQTLARELQLDTADKTAGEFARTAVQLGLDRDGASKLAELHHQHQTEVWERTRDSWRSEALASPTAELEIGFAKSALSRFGDPKLNEFLAQGYGDNPAIIGFLARVGRALGER